MMLILYTLAGLFLAFSAFCMFGLPYMLMGPRMLDQLAERADQKVMASVLVAAAISLVLLPFLGSGLISDGSHVQVFAGTLTGFTGRA
jgi:hypothetical protein